MLEVPELAGGNPQLQKAMNKVVKAEERTLQKFDDKIAKEEGLLKLVRDFKGKASEAKDAVTPFKSVKDFRELKGVSSDPEIISVSNIDKNLAELGSYDLEVLQLAMSNSISTYGFPDKDKTQVGIGYISFETGTGENKEVYINSENNTLEGLAKSINAAHVGVRALVVNDGSDADEPYRLLITGEKTGWKENITWPEFNLLDGDVDLDIDRTREAQSAIIRFNGEPIMVDRNKVTDLLPGVTLDLHKAKEGQTVKVEISPDYEKVEGKVKNMVEKINGVLSFIQDQNKLGENSRGDPSKALGGDVTLHGVEYRLREIIQKSESSLSDAQIQRMRDLGIGFNRNGTLDYDAKKFQSLLESNFDEVVAFFAGDMAVQGFGREIEALFDSVSRSRDGLATIKETGSQARLKKLKDDKEKGTEKAQAKIEKTKTQLAKAEAAISQMQQMQGPGGVASLMPHQ